MKLAVKQLLTKLRPGDAATLIGFNDTPFTVAEREKDSQTREAAVDLLESWGGTALYDATVRALDMVSREWGRKGVVIFSDGDDRNSLTKRETAMARVQSSDAMLYTIGFGMGSTVPLLRSSLENYARASGGRTFFPRQTRELDGVFDAIVAELANQYVLSYSSTNSKQDSNWRKSKCRCATASTTSGRGAATDRTCRSGHRVWPRRRTCSIEVSHADTQDVGRGRVRRVRRAAALGTTGQPGATADVSNRGRARHG